MTYTLISSSRCSTDEQAKPSDGLQKELRRMCDTNDYSFDDLAELFSISRPTAYRTLKPQAAKPAKA